MTRLRHIAAINPPTPGFDRLGSDTILPFVPLEAVWSEGLDLSRAKPKSEVATGYTRFQERDILVPKITPTFQADRATIARGIDGGVAAGTTELHVVRVHPGVDERYVRYLLSSREFLEGGEAEMIGVAGQKRVPDVWLRDLRVPFTNLTRQRAIADYLDTETARIDALITKKQRMIELLDERWQAELAGLVLGARATSEKSPTPLGPTPSHWRMARVRQVVARAAVGVVVNPSSYFTEEGVPFLHGSNVLEGRFDLGSVKRISARDSALLWRSQLEPGDVVVVRAGFPGRAAVVTDDLRGANCASVLVLKLNRLVLPPFLELFINSSRGRAQVAAAQYGAAQEQINLSDIVDFLVPVPPLEEQGDIIRRSTKARAANELARAKLERQIELLREHRQALITAAVTGELEVPGVAA